MVERNACRARECSVPQEVFCTVHVVEWHGELVDVIHFVVVVAMCLVKKLEEKNEYIYYHYYYYYCDNNKLFVANCSVDHCIHGTCKL